MTMITTNNAISAAQTILGAVQEEAAVARLIHDGDKRAANLNTFDRQNIVRTQLVKHAWQTIGRQVLAMHPEIVEEVRVASSDKIPGEVLRVLPYMNPLVIFADPPVFKSWLAPGEKHRLTGQSEDSMRLLGFFTYGSANVQVNEPILHDDEVKPGMRVEQRIYSTNAPEADRFGMMLVLEALDKAGRVIDLEFNSMTIYFDQNLTLGETVEELMSRFKWDSDKYGDLTQHDQQHDPRNTNRHRKWMRDVLSVAIGSLFYLCSTTLEAEKVPTKSVARRVNSKIVRKPFSLYQVGWATGAALTRYRQSRKAGWKESEQSDITHEQDPQHRRSHFKMQPCGPRNSERKLVFVSAYWTHVEKLGEMGVNTARGVPKVDGKGAARQSAKVAMGVRDE